jgi:hypothetical protein
MFLSDVVVVLSFDLRGVDPVDTGLEVEGEYLGQFDELLLSLDPALRAGGFEELGFCGDGVFVDGEPLLFLTDEYRYRVFVVEARSGVSSSQSVDLVYRSTHVMRLLEVCPWQPWWCRLRCRCRACASSGPRRPWLLARSELAHWLRRRCDFELMLRALVSQLEKVAR